VAVTPVFEGAAELDVAEAFVPAEVFDLGFPGDAEGSEGEGAEADGEEGAVAGGYAGVAWGSGGTRWGRGENGFFNAGALPGRHEAGQVFRVREEGEDQLGGVGEPLRGFEVKVHSLGF